MQDYVHGVAEWLSLVVEGGGILAIVLGLIYALLRGLLARRRQGSWVGVYEGLRKNIGRTLLLGLEFFLAAEIIRSIMVGEEFDSVVVLGLVVVIRTFLSISIDMEINGHWPWQAAQLRDDTQESVGSSASRS